MRITVHADKCTGCKVCELACYYSKSRKFNPHKSRIRIVKLDRVGVDYPILCKFCSNPACIAGCPEGALYQDQNNIIRVDEVKCKGCWEFCVNSCEFGAIFFDGERRLPLICDLCHGEPACVKWCPTLALETKGNYICGEVEPKRIGEKSEALQKPSSPIWQKRKSYAMKKAKALMKRNKVPEDLLKWHL